jgi:hypothetical protein
MNVAAERTNGLFGPISGLNPPARMASCFALTDDQGTTMTVAILSSRTTCSALAAIWLVAALLPAAAGTLPKAKPEDVGMSSERLARVNDVGRCDDAGEVAGVVPLIARRGKVVHFEAQGYATSHRRSRCAPTIRLARPMGSPLPPSRS